MKFTSIQIAKLAEITGVNLRQQQNLGFYSPSVTKGSGKGSSNIWSLADAYQIRIVNDLIKSGWARKKAAEFIKAIDYKGLTEIIATGLLLRDKILQADFYKNLDNDKIISIVKGDIDKTAEQRKFAIDNIMQWGAAGKIWLAFGRFGKKILCRSAIENDPRCKEMGLEVGQEISYSAVLAGFKTADEVYVYQLNRAMDAIEKKLVMLFPEKLVEFNMIYWAKIEAQIMVLKDGEGIKLEDSFKFLARLISGKD